MYRSKSFQKKLYFSTLVTYLIFLVIGCVDHGNDLSPVTDIETDVTDIDGNSYRTESIGNKIWMIENLKVTHYNDGTPIHSETENEAWCKLKTGAFCNFNNDTLLVKTYGRLYNWIAVNSPKKIAPKGWHVATEQEWADLVETFGGDSVAGSKLKEEGIVNWEKPNNGADNSSKFTALPGGFRNHIDGDFYGIYGHGFWWTSTNIDKETAYAFALGYRNSHAGCCITDKNRGFSIRCVRD